MTPADIQYVLHDLVALEERANGTGQFQVGKICEQALAVIEDLRKDRERLEWLTNQESFVSSLPDGSCYVADVAGICEYPQRSTAREAIEEAMTKRV